MPGFARSSSGGSCAASPAPRGRARFVANTTGLLDAGPRRTARPEASCSRRRRRRACTPWRICAASSSEPANERRTSASVEVVAAGVRASVSDEAAETTRRGALRRRRIRPTQPSGEQRDRVRRAHLTVRSRPSPTSPSRSRLRAPPVRARAPHRVARDAAVTRNGPASISTSAITPSTSTERTTPGKRLRAESGRPPVAAGARASRSTSAAARAGGCARRDRPELAGAVPAAQRVVADADRFRRLAEGQSRAIVA